ncbi:MAG TPA: NUDIX hydrolase [Candidatus Diapherotrites archaeon]|nr:NUDIX hydrolase [Candidatus Diapherotrites archaeon]
MKYNKLLDKYLEDERVVNSGIIIFNKDKILLIERKDKKHWELPGGKIKLLDAGKTKNVTLKNAALREVFEEVNIKPKILKYPPFYIDFETPDKIKRRSYNFIGESTKQPRITEKHVFSKAKYVAVKDLEEYNLAPNVKTLVELFKTSFFGYKF